MQHVMAEMERVQAKGEVPEEELKALELDMTGKVRRSARAFCGFPERFLTSFRIGRSGFAQLRDREVWLVALKLSRHTPAYHFPPFPLRASSTAASEVSSILESRIAGTSVGGNVEETGRVLSESRASRIVTLYSCSAQASVTVSPASGA